MAVDLATARQAAQKRGLKPPPEWAGNEDNWYLQWFQGGIDAGDPSILRDAGLWAGTEDMQSGQTQTGGQGYATDYMSAAPSSEWMGKRKPTPRELRRFANESKQSEDYARFSDAQLSAWINKSWDPVQGAFFNDYGDRVEKPTESGPLSHAAGAATGEKGVGGGGGGGGGGGRPAQPAEAVTRGKAGDISYTGNPMTDMLIYQFNNRDMLNGQGTNIFGALGGDTRPTGEIDKNTGERTMPDVTGQLLKGGGLWWTDTADAKDTFKGYGKPITKPAGGGGGGGAAAPPAAGTTPGYTPGPETPAAPPLDQPVPRGGATGMLLNKRRQGYFDQPGGGEFIRPY